MHLFSKIQRQKVPRSEDIHCWDVPGARTRKYTSLFIHLHSALSAKTVMVLYHF